MGNKCSFGKKVSPTQLKVRRVYVGNNCPYIDEDEVPLGKNGLIERTSQQSFSEKELAVESIPSMPTPVRRQSMSVPSARHKPRNVYPSNFTKSSRYTLYNFLPLNLFEQFRRVVNFYFLIVAIIQSSTDSPVSPITAIAPLGFVVFVSMIKQGYEDWLRHKNDDSFNNRPVKVVRDGVIEVIKSKDVRVGDIIKIEGSEQVPTDIVLIASSDEFQRCQLNTANLDGETNLKMRYCPAGLPHFRDESDFMTLNLIIECEPPCEDLYQFNGNILMPEYTGGLHHVGSMGTVIEVPEPEDECGQDDPDPPKEQEHPHPPKSKLEVCTTLDSNVHKPNPPREEDQPQKEQPTKTASESDNARMSRSNNLSSSFGPQTGLFTGKYLQIVLGIEHMLFRGTKVKNTDFIYGIVLYTGDDTKLARNSNKTSPKFSTVEKSVNKYLVVFIITLLLLVITASLLSIFVDWFPDPLPWYLERQKADLNVKHYFNIFTSFLILFNYIIPISLYVTMEMQKFIGSKFFVWDAEMATENGEPPLCNTSDLNEELGQIEYLFSDKTGTLTENVMKFRVCSINSTRYDFDVETSKLYRCEAEDESRKTLVEVKNNKDVMKFLKTLALCHSVQLMPVRRPSVDYAEDTKFDLFSKKKRKISSKVKNANSLFTIGSSTEPLTLGIMGGKWEFQASSPDEKALVESCAKLGVLYYGEKDEMMSIDVCGQMEAYKRHLVLEFDSDRKCMSVVIETEKGEIYVLTKGADSSVLPRCDNGPSQETFKRAIEFAMMGMRTLVIAERKLSRAQLDGFIERLKGARRVLQNREAKIREIYRDIESHLTVIGATGVEDQLQEGVEQTLMALGAAGIRVWMLTGDKLETGLAVALSCGIITPGSKKIVITEFRDTMKEELLRRLEEIKEEMIPDDNTTFIVDGQSIAIALREFPTLFCEISMQAFRVVCVRMTPLQKAQIVRMVRSTPGNPITAAVGDGANDVAMIQEAHIGIGILGKEGRQAARCADFALARFGFLRKAILVHGHWYYVRLATLANYFFYKNIVFILPQVFYCFHSSFSTQALFDGIFLMLYNILYSACPILFYGLFEQPYPAKELMNRPYLYKEISKNRLMQPDKFIRWSIFAIWHAAICFYFVYFSWTSFQPINDLPSFGAVVFCGVVAVVNFKIALETRYVHCLYVGSQIYSYVMLFVTTALYSEVNAFSVVIDPEQFRHVYFKIQSTYVFWIIMPLITFTAIAPDVIFKACEQSHLNMAKLIKIIRTLRTPRKPLRNGQEIDESGSDKTIHLHPTTSSYDSLASPSTTNPNATVAT